MHRVVEQVDTWVEGAEAAEGIRERDRWAPGAHDRLQPSFVAGDRAVSVPHPVAAATDTDGQRVRVQQIPSGEVTYSPTRSLLRAPVPALGYRRYWLHVVDPAGSVGEAGAEPATATADGILANGFLRVKVDMDTGRMVHLAADGMDLPRGTELLAGGVRPVIVDDDSDTWSHGVDRYSGDEEEGQPALGPGGRDRSCPRHGAQHLVVRSREDHGGPGRLASTRATPPSRSVSTSIGTRPIGC